MLPNGWQCRLEISGKKKSILETGRILGVEPYVYHVRGTGLSSADKRVERILKLKYPDWKPSEQSTWAYKVEGSTESSVGAILDLIEVQRDRFFDFLNTNGFEARITIIISLMSFDMSTTLSPQMLKRLGSINLPLIIQVYLCKMSPDERRYLRAVKAALSNPNPARVRTAISRRSPTTPKR